MIISRNPLLAIRGIAYSLKVSKDRVKDRILLALDKTPLHGYDLLQTLPIEVGRPQLTTLYRWLHEMEAEGLAKSKIHPGPHGPDRRVYELGPRGETRLREILRNSIDVVLHFYDSYRHTAATYLFDVLDVPEIERVEGRILFAAFPRLKERDLRTIEYLSERNSGEPLDILGDCTLVSRTRLPFRELKGNICDVAVPNEALAEIWLSGVPERSVLPRAIAECKRVLVQGGILKIIAPFAFFEEPARPSLGEFIRVTATHLFPELGVVEGDDVGTVIEANFTDCGAFETFPGLVVFWAVKD
ncbi:MAG: PadR family transcriptional regulator [Promethearchaeota archaeon]